MNNETAATAVKISNGFDDISRSNTISLSCGSCHLFAEILFSQVNLTAFQFNSYSKNWINFLFIRPATNQKLTETTPKADNDVTKQSVAKQTVNNDVTKLSLAKQTQDNLPTKMTESQYNSKKVKENIRGYVFTRFMDYVKNYERAVEKKYPRAFKTYRVYMDGVASFYRDMVDYVKISTKLLGAPENLEKLTRHELEVYYQLPRDMRKVGPLLVVSAIPFAQYITMPIAYVLMSCHFRFN